MADSVKIKITGDDSDFRRTLGNVGQTAAGVFKGMLGSQLVTAGVTALTNGLRGAITTSMQFEAAMDQVAAISGATGAELDRLTEAAKHYGETTMFSASQAAEALNYMALAGWDVQQSLDALPGVLDLAAASGMALGAASDAVTDYLSAFGMEASKAGYMADLMAYAQSRSNTSATQLSDAYGNCATSMHAAGQDIETTTSMLMALANQGIKGSEAGTQMAAVMRDLTQKMENGQIMIGKTAVKVTDAEGNFRDLNDIIMDVGKATEGMGTAEQSAAIMTTFTARSVKAIQTLLNEGVENVNQYEEALRGSEGTAAEQAKTMMDNLQGDVKIFQSALEGVQITAGEAMNDSARAVVQMGTDVMEAVNQGGKTNGLAGMAEAFIKQIPKLMPQAINGVKSLIAGIGQQLPGLMQSMFATLPDLLTGALDLAPVLLESLGGAVEAATSGLISNLPNMLSSVFTNLPGILAGLAMGAFKGANGIIGGIELVLKDIGIINPDLNDNIQQALGTAGKLDHEAVDYDLDVDVNTEVSVDDYKTKVETAINTIKEALLGIPGLDEGTRSKIEKAIMEGSGADALTAALAALDVPEDEAGRIAEQLKTAFTTIDTTLSDLNLTAAQKGVIADVVAAGGDVKQALIDLGVDETAASEAAGKLTDAWNLINDTFGNLNLDTANISTLAIAGEDVQTALTNLGVDSNTAADVAGKINDTMSKLNSALEGMGLSDAAIKVAQDAAAAGQDVQQALTDFGVDPTTAEAAAQKVSEAVEAVNGQLSGLSIDTSGMLQMFINAGYDKTMIKASLQLLGLDDVDIDTILSSYDTVANSFSTRITAAKDAILAALQNGVNDLNDPELDKAKEEFQAAVEEAYNKINTWRDEKIQELEESGLTGEALDEKVQAINEQADALTSAVTDAKEQVESFTGDALNKSGQWVRENADILNDAVAELELANATLEHLMGLTSSGGLLNRKAVQQGLVSDSEGIAEAINYTEQELEASLTKAQTDASNALEQADKDFAGDAEGYAKRRKEIMDKKAEIERAAYETYNTEMGRIVNGAIMADADLSEGLNGVIDEVKQRNLAGEIQRAILDNANADGAEPLTMESLLGSLNIQESDIDSLAKSIGIDGGRFREALINAMKSGGTGDASMAKGFLDILGLGDFANKADEVLGSALEGVDLSNIQTAFSWALESGLLTGTDEVDWKDYKDLLHSYLETYLRDAVGETEPVDLELEPEVTASDDTPEKVEEAIEDATAEGGSGTVDAEIKLDSDVEVAEDTPEKISEAMSEATDGAGGETVVEAPVSVEPTVANPEDTRQALVTAIQNASEGMTLDNVLENANIERVDFDALASQMGLDPGALENAINGALKSADPAAALTGMFVGVDLSSLLQPVGEGITGGVTQGITSTAGEAADASRTMGQDAAEAAGEGAQVNSPSAITIPFGEGITEGVTQGIEGTAGQAADAAQTMGQQAAEATATGITGAAGTVSSAIQSMVDNAINAGNGAASSATDIGGAIADNTASGVSSGAGTVDSAASGMVSGAISAASGAASGASAIGSAISAGIAVGIAAGQSAVIAAAIALAQAAINAAKSALSIASPSKVTYGFGEMFDKGMEQGIVEHTQEVVRSAVTMARNVAGAANLTPHMDFAEMKSTVRNALSDFADIEQSRDVVLNLDGRELARTTTPYNVNEQNSYNHRLALNYGRK